MSVACAKRLRPARAPQLEALSFLSGVFRVFGSSQQLMARGKN